MEYRTVAIYHACDTSLTKLDKIQERLLEAAGISQRDALFACRLAPLSTRRDIALLGVVHRMVLGKGPAQFREYFKLTQHPKSTKT
eukprot:6049342-Karenia_brevis.AAC.1